MSFPPLLNGPIPPYNNPAIQAGYYLPRQFFISAISLGQTTTITTTVNHDYVLGQLCRLIIPPAFGTIQLNLKIGYVILLPALNQVVLNIVSQGFSAFVEASTRTQKAQIIAVGDINSGDINANGPKQLGTFIPGSFIDISPN